MSGTATERWWELLPFTTHRYQLGEGLWTRDGDVNLANDARVKLTCSLVKGYGGRLLDLGCLEGGLTVECARQGAFEATGVEPREISWRRCELARRLTGLPILFFQTDAMTFLASVGGGFDVILCAGLLYHLPEPSIALQLMADHASFLVLDTHVAREDAPFPGCGELTEHHGCRGRWYDEGADEAQRRAALWSAWDNARSFWPLEPDLERMSRGAGWKSVEKLDPAKLGEWNVNPKDRVLWLLRR